MFCLPPQMYNMANVMNNATKYMLNVILYAAVWFVLFAISSEDETEANSICRVLPLAIIVVCFVCVNCVLYVFTLML